MDRSDINNMAILPILLVIAAAYLIPTIIAMTRKHNNTAAIAVVNIALGWTFLGYLVALVWSLTNSESKNQIVINQIAQQPPHLPPSLPNNAHMLPDSRSSAAVIDVSPVRPEKSLKNQLEELKELLESGLVSEEEYQNKRKELLS